jgi:hypothetical protein
MFLFFHIGASLPPQFDRILGKISFKTCLCGGHVCNLESVKSMSGLNYPAVHCEGVAI